MLNHDPIFVNGFSRGGTTILTNLLASHPDVCLLGETHHAFKGTSITDGVWDVLRKCLFHDAPIILRQMQDVFSPRLIKPRKPLSAWAKRHVDVVLHREKLRSVGTKFSCRQANAMKKPGDEFTIARTLCKNIDGMIYTTDAWAEMYPDAVFFGLVRNGLAVCEGHIRRGRSATEIGWRYQRLVAKMLADRERIANYHVLRFEDLLKSPWDSLRSCCAHARLETGRISQIRMQVRRVMDKSGNHRLCGNREWDVHWMTPNQLAHFVHQDVDENQIRRLTLAERDAFVSEAGQAMEQLGYSTDLKCNEQRTHEGERSSVPPNVLPFPGSRVDEPSQIARAA